MSETIQIQADWAQTDSTQIDFIKNKPSLYEEWWGTQAEYDAILVKDPDKIYNIETVEYTVSISAGNNGSVTVNGVAGNYSTTVVSGTVLTIEGVGNTGYNFDEWSDGNTTNPRTITVTSNLTLTASFESIPNYFYLEDISGSDNTLTIVGNTANVPATEIFKSTDGTNWTSMGTTSDTPITATIPTNSKLYLKATTNALTTDYNNYVHTSTTGNYNIGGCIASLIFGDNCESGTITEGTNNYAFAFLFYNDTHLIDASNLVLPSSTARRCYQYMFNGCTNLVTPPSVIYGNTAYINQCEGMFAECTSLTTAPELPATTLAGTSVVGNCYGGMFLGCTSLTTAPALPATTLKPNCYDNMFNGCTSLTTAPELKATTLVTGCYKGMFTGCTSLVSVTTYAQDISATDCLTNWMSNVAASGDFYNEGGATYTVDSASGIPQGWTEHTPPKYFYVEDISGSDNTLSIKKATNLSPSIEVFKSTDTVNWTSMGTTSTTPITATIPANSKLYLKAQYRSGNISYCNPITCSGNHNVGGNIMSLVYGDNFENQTTLNNLSYCLNKLFSNNQTLKNANDLLLPATTLATGCYYQMFNNCRGLLTAPTILPATTLTQKCYYGMFYECRTLTTSPTLPATTLVQDCYNQMFYNCKVLNNITTYATDISADKCLNNWLLTVAAQGDFYNLGGATYTVDSASGIPSGWTEHTSL